MSPAAPIDSAALEVLVLGATEESPPPGLPPSDARVRYRFADDPASVRALLPQAEALFHWESRTELLREAWPTASRLRWMHVSGVGVDWSIFPELTDSDVVVTNCRGVFDVTLPEYVLALMLALAKDIPATVRYQELRRWEHRPGEPLHGKRTLILGAGGVGRATARLLAAVGMEVRLVGRRERPASPDHPAGLDHPAVHAVDHLRELLPEADWLVLCLPLTDATRGLIGSSELALLPPGARVVNVGRGPLVDEPALIEALRDGRLAGAALDVFEIEPLPTDHPLWVMPGVIISPHIGGDVAGWLGWFTRSFLENLGRYRAGEPLRDVVDKHSGYIVEAIEGG